MTRRPRWLPHEITILRALIFRGRTYEVIAAVLTRHTRQAIQQKASDLWLAPKGYKRPVTVRNGVVRYGSPNAGPLSMRRARRAARMASQC